MQVSQGILTVRGGMTSTRPSSPAAWAPAASPAAATRSHRRGAKTITIDGHTFHEGDLISIDGSTGNVYEGQIATVGFHLGDFGRVMGWADEVPQLKVRTNADNPHDAQSR